MSHIERASAVLAGLQHPIRVVGLGFLNVQADEYSALMRSLPKSTSLDPRTSEEFENLFYEEIRAAVIDALNSVDEGETYETIADTVVSTLQEYV